MAIQFVNMAYFRNDAWKEDSHLEQDLRKYVKQMLTREEILSFVTRDYSEYAWSIRSLDRRLRHFGISYTDKDIGVDEVREAVKEELHGPGKLLGYRAMQKKLRQEKYLQKTEFISSETGVNNNTRKRKATKEYDLYNSFVYCSRKIKVSR